MSTFEEKFISCIINPRKIPFELYTTIIINEKDEENVKPLDAFV